MTLRSFSFGQATGLIMLFVLSLSSLQSFAQLDDWRFRRQITIQENAGITATNYQVLIFLDLSADCALGRVDPQGDDLRFALDCDGVDTISYYLDGGVCTDTMAVWLKMPTWIANGQHTVYVFYDNPAAPPASSFDAVFPPATRLDLAGGVTTLSGTQQFSSIEIGNLATIQLVSGQPLELRARRIVMDGTILGDGMGSLGAILPIAPGNGNCAGQTTGQNASGGGGGYGGQGGDGGEFAAGDAGQGGCVAGTNQGMDIQMGTGGGSGFPSSAGGNGGGLVMLDAARIVVGGSISLDGLDGFNSDPVFGYGGGGGSGGGLRIRGLQVNLTNATFNANGGEGGYAPSSGIGVTSGGSGGGGRIKVFYDRSRQLAGTNMTVIGGVAIPSDPGSTPGEAGDDGVLAVTTWNAGEATISAVSGANDRPLRIFGSDPNNIYCDQHIATFNTTLGHDLYYFFINDNIIQASPSEVFNTFDLAHLDTVFVVGETGLCRDTSDTIIVTIIPRPVVTATPSGPYCPSDPIDTLIAMPQPGIWSSPDPGIVDAASGIYSPSDAGPGVHRVYYVHTDANNCRNTDSFDITIFTLPDATISPAGPFCPEDPKTNLVSVTPGGTWAGTGITNATTGTFDPALAPPGTHKITYAVTDGNGCIGRDTVDIVVLQKPDATIVTTGPYCTNFDSVQLVAATLGGTWLGSPFVRPNGIFYPKQAGPGQHTVLHTVTGGNGCVSVSQDTVIVTPELIANAGPNKAYCIGQPVQIGGNPSATGGNGGYVYSWAPGFGLSSISVSNPMASPNSNFVYTLTVGDGTGCTDKDEVIVLVRQAFVADAGSDRTICDGETVLIGGAPTALGGTKPYTYSWLPITGLGTPTLPNPSAKPSTTTAYTVFATDSGGCIATDSMTVFVNPTPVANAGPDMAICRTETAQIGGNPAAIGGTPPITFAWKPATGLNATNVPNPMAKPLTSKEYFLDITDVNGCGTSDSMTLTIYDRPLVDAGPDTSICMDGPGGFIGGNGTASGGKMPYTYLWQPASGVVGSNTVGNPLVKPAGATMFTVTVTDANGCVRRDSLLVDYHLAPIAEAGDPHLICRGEQVVIGGNPTALGTDPFVYSWGPTNKVNLRNIPNPTTKISATTTFTVQITDSNGCVDIDSVLVDVIQRADVDFTGIQNPYCVADDPVKLFPSPAGGTFTGLGVVNNGKAYSKKYLSQNLSIPDNHPNGAVASFVVSGAPGNTLGGDIYLASVNLKIDHGRVGDLKAVLINPAGHSVVLFDRPGVPITQIGCIGANMDICVVVGNANPPLVESVCNDHDPTIQGTYRAVQDLNFLNNMTKANGVWRLEITDRQQGVVGKLGSFSLNFGTPALFDPSVSGKGAHAVTYSYNDCFSCTTSKSKVIVVNASPVVKPGADRTICSASNTTLGAAPTASGSQAPYTYAWSPITGLNNAGVANPVATVSSATTYEVTVVDANGCSTTEKVNVRVDPAPDAAFTVTHKGLLVDFADQSVGPTAWHWDFDDATISNVQNPKHVFSAPGPYNVCLTVSNKFGCEDEVCQIVQVAAPTATNDPALASARAFPNPTNGALRIQIEEVVEDLNVSVLDLNGRTLMTLPWQGRTTGMDIDMSDLAGGTYLVRLQSALGQSIFRIVKSN